MSSYANITILFPESTTEIVVQDATSTSFNVSAQGHGSFSGFAFTVPGHTKGKIKGEIQTPAITSDKVKDLNTLIDGFVSASEREKVREYERTHASANLSYWAFWSGGGSASYEKTRESMKSSGLTDAHIAEIINEMLEIAKKMSAVQIDLEVDNTANDYTVSGNFLLYTLAGTISSGTETAQYRMLANKGTAGSAGASAPTSGQIIPLN